MAFEWPIYIKKAIKQDAPKKYQKTLQPNHHREDRIEDLKEKLASQEIEKASSLKQIKKLKIQSC
jgi:cell division septum initiation protein DivIVA